MPSSQEKDISTKTEERYHIIYENRGIIVVDKMVGLPTQPTRNQQENLYELLLIRYPYVGLHHRLDQATSGLLLFTTRKKHNAAIAQQLQDRKIERLYTCVTLGAPKEHSGQWSSNIDGRNAITNWTCLKSNPTSSLLHVQLHTGRKHQIRIHTNRNNVPILGDRRYGHAGKLAKRLCLHAHQITFKDPTTSKDITVESPIPSDMQMYIDRI